jgi:tetratricopeptide (TPR) repeat protein
MIDKLDRLPLALTQAGAYLRETNISVASYIKHYDNTWKDLMEEQGRYALREYGDRSSILTTWVISYKQIASESEGAANLLKLWGFLDHKDLWYSLISPVLHCSPGLEVPRWLSKLAEHEIQFDRALRILRRYSLIDAAGQQTASHAIHAVLHAWCYCLSIGDEQRTMLLLAITIVACAAPPESEVARWKLQRRLLPHGMYVHSRLNMLRRQHSWTSDDEDNIPGWTDHTLGRLFAHQTKLSEAEMLFKRALSRSEKALGEEDMTTLGVMNDLGNVHSRQGKLAEAEDMYKRSLAVKEKVLGPEHMDTLSTLYNLANLSCKQRKLVEAESMYEQVLLGYEKALGPDHLSTLTTVNNLGSLYVDRDKLAEAEVMNKRALACKVRVLGAENKSTLGTAKNLGNLYWTQGKLAEAEAMYERVLAGYETAFGTEHTNTLSIVNDLGNLHYAHGKPAEAELMYKRALAGYDTRARTCRHIQHDLQPRKTLLCTR